MTLYTSACRVIIEKLGSCHVALACPTFNIANIMCAAGTFARAIDFYRIAYSINVQELGQVCMFICIQCLDFYLGAAASQVATVCLTGARAHVDLLLALCCPTLIASLQV